MQLGIISEDRRDSRLNLLFGIVFGILQLLVEGVDFGASVRNTGRSARLTGRPDSFDLFVVCLLQSNHALLKLNLRVTNGVVHLSARVHR